MRTTMKSTTLWEENKMKILEDYKKIAHELLFEVDDEKMIKYKDKDGESKEMKAGSAKTMPMDHPAKQAWDKMAAKDDAGDDSGAEKEKGQKIGGSDFDRDSGADKPKGDMGDYRAKGKARMEKKYGIEIPDGKPGDLYDDDVAYKIVDTLAKKFDMSKEYAMMQAGDELGGGYHDSYYSLANSLENNFQEMADEGGHQKYDEPAYDTRGMEKMKYGGGDSGDDGEKPKPKGKPNYNSKEYYEIEGNDTMGHLSREEQSKLVKFFNRDALQHSSGHAPLPKDDLSVDKDGFVRFGDPNDPDRPGEGDIVGKIKDDTTHDELKDMIKNNAGPIIVNYYKQFGASAKSDDGDAKSDDSDKKYAGLKSYEVSMAKDADEEIAKYGKHLPSGTDFRTKIEDLDEDDVDAFYDDVADKYAEEYDITMGVFDDNKNYFMDKEGATMSDLVSGIKSSAEEAAEEGGYMKYGESVKPKNKHFLREQLERFGGGKY